MNAPILGWIFAMLVGLWIFAAFATYVLVQIHKVLQQIRNGLEHEWLHRPGRYERTPHGD